VSPVRAEANPQQSSAAGSHPQYLCIRVTRLSPHAGALAAGEGRTLIRAHAPRYERCGRGSKALCQEATEGTN